MFKIISCHANIESGVNIYTEGLRMLDESFETFKEAEDFILTTLLFKSTEKWEEVSPYELDKVSTNIEKVDDDYVIGNFYGEAPCYLAKYKIVEVK